MRQPSWTTPTVALLCAAALTTGSISAVSADTSDNSPRIASELRRSNSRSVQDLSVKETDQATAQRLYDTIKRSDSYSPPMLKGTGCSADQLDQENRDKVLTTVNAFREFANAQPLRLAPNSDPSWKELHASVVALQATSNAANGTLSLSHGLSASDAPSSLGRFLCNTTQASNGTSRSNLGAIGTSSRGPLRGFIRNQIDDDFYDIDPGHRLWLLNPGRTELVTGMVRGPRSAFIALDAFGGAGNNPADTPNIVAWPPAGSFPRELTAIRAWSVTLPGIKIPDGTRVSATVETPDGKTLTPTAHIIRTPMDSHTVTFNPRLGWLKNGTYTVKVTVGDQSVTYPINIFAADPQAQLAGETNPGAQNQANQRPLHGTPDTDAAAGTDSDAQSSEQSSERGEQSSDRREQSSDRREQSSDRDRDGDASSDTSAKIPGSSDDEAGRDRPGFSSENDHATDAHDEGFLGLDASPTGFLKLIPTLLALTAMVLVVFQPPLPPMLPQPPAPGNDPHPPLIPDLRELLPPIPGLSS